MHVAVVIVGFRNADDIVRCTAALAHSTYKDFDVVVCENGGKHAYHDLVQALPDRLPGGQSVRLVLAPRNLGYAGGVNLGIASAQEADAYWVLNPDTEPAPDVLERLVSRLAAGD